MEDRELLELAAKAAGYVIHGFYEDGTPELDVGTVWNPLTDDGDALRLAVKLRLDVNIEDEAQVTWWQGEDLESICVPFEDDECAAARRAIVRAAAEIGRSMP